MKLLDLFCGAGGAAEGYRRAGIHCIVGVDHRPQPNYPFAFIQADALEYAAEFGHLYDAIHASPPCQAYSTLRHLHKKAYPELIEPTRRVLEASGRLYVIENVDGSPLNATVILCGTMFNLGVRRHRLFECNFSLPEPPPCCHNYPVVGVYGRPGGKSIRDIIRRGRRCNRGDTQEWRAAMGIHWMATEELTQAIPPAYTEWIGYYLLAAAARSRHEATR